MKKDDIYYGLDGWEHLADSEDEAIETIVNEACDALGEKWETIASRITWPIELLKFKRRDTGGEIGAKYIAETILCDTLEGLDEEYGDIDGDYTRPTDKMRKAAVEFGQAVIDGYVPWQCEPNGEIVTFTKEEVEKDFGDD